MHKLLVNQRGAIGLLTTLMVSVVLLILALAVVLNGISSRFNTFLLTDSDRLLLITQGCVEDSLLRLARDSNYSGGAVVIGGVSCTVSVQGTAPDLELTVSASDNSFTKALQLDVTLAAEPALAATVTDWIE